MTLNFNVKPYYDDFDPNKNFHRILFKPGYAVQARELTQSQTILQDQISKFASSIFSQNTPISGGKVTVNLNCNYLKLFNDFNGINIVASDWKNKIITDATGTILARVIATHEGTGTNNAGDPPTLIVTYISGQQFTDYVDIFPTDGSNIGARTIGTAGGTTSVGKASVASITEGVFYVVNGYNTSNIPNDDGTYSKYSIGNFVSVLQQTVILDKYSNTPSLRVGLTITESVTTSTDDPSLFDPAIGASNYQAPGADRYTIKLDLITLPLQLGSDDGFIELMRIQSGDIVKQVDGTVYSIIDDYFAKRTFDTNGDFIVQDFNLTPVANTSSNVVYDLRVGKGLAYVRGYRVENQSDTIITNDRARSTSSQNNNSVFVDYGSYFKITNVKGLFDTTAASNVDLHCVTTPSTTTLLAYNSTLIGSGYIRGLVYDRNTSDSNTSSYVFKAYVHDIITNTLAGNITAFTANSITTTDTKFLAQDDAYYGVIVTIDSGNGAGYRGQITHWTSGKIAYLNPPFTASPDTNSKFSLRFATEDTESIANTLLAIVTSQTKGNVDISGKTDGYPLGDAIFNNTGNPELLYELGFPFVSTITDSLYYTTKIFRGQAVSTTSQPNSQLILDLTSIDAPSVDKVEFEGPKGSAMSADTFKQNYIVIVSSTGDAAASGPVGTILDFTSSGNTATISSDGKQLTLTSNHWKPLSANPLSVTVIAKMNVIDATASPVFKTKTLVIGSSSVASNTGPDGIINNTYVDLTNGQVYIKNAALLGTSRAQTLYVTDIKKVTKIIDTGSPTTPPTVAMLTDSNFDVTANFTLNNGQKDSYYDHGSVTLNPGAPIPRGDILIVFNYYSHSGGDGYFAVGSYVNEAYAEIGTYASKNGNIYRLADSLDFRPTRKNATSTFAYQYSSSDPGSTNSAGTYLPQDLTNWVSDYSYYLGRKDLLVLTKDKNFKIIQGVPAINPILPSQPDGSLSIANLTHDPYTAYLPSEAPKGILPNLSVAKIQHRRWTMKDISDLQTRVNNIEYYTSLSLLEQQTQTLQVTDANGLNRFKNGILVDDFSTNGVADTANPDFSASIDRVAKRMTATQTVENFPFQASDALGAIHALDLSPYSYSIKNVGKGTNIFSLPYSNTSVIVQQLASNTINLNPFTTPIFQGVCYLNPPMDNWVDNTKEPDLLLVDPNLHVYQQSKKLNLLNVTNWQTIPGSRHQTAPKRTTTRGHGINPSPFGNAGYSTTTYETVEKQEASQTKGYWTNLGSSYSEIGNGFITDISIQPYIRAQDISFRAKGLLINTPVSAYFDGENVNEDISMPDVLELYNVSGTFNDNDVIGYTDTISNTFFPIATVLGVYVYPDTNNAKIRLYIVSNFHTSHKNFSLSNIIRNAKFSGSGVYQRSTAYGSANVTSGVIGYNSSGTVNAIGGTHLDAVGNTQHTFVHTLPGQGEFLNMFGVWGDPYGSFSHYNHTYNVDFPSNGTYYFQAAVSSTSIATFVYLDGTLILSGFTGTISQIVSEFVTGGVHTIQLVGTSLGLEVGLHIAAAVSTASWKASGDNHLYNAHTDGTIIFNTRTPSTLIPGDSSIGAITNMYGGGKYYTDVTKIGLHPSAHPSSNVVYVGSKIHITTTLITAPTKAGRKPKTTVLKYTRTITAYDSTKRIVTLSSTVKISAGYNKALGKSITSRYSLKGTAKSYAIAIQNNTQPDHSTNENGDFIGIFHVPPETFRNGERIFRIDNRLTDGDAGSATTYAEATFTASGLSTKSQSIHFSPSISGAKNTFTSTKTREKVISTVSVKNKWDPVAQTFIIDGENYPNGIFLNSAKFFFRTKPTTVATPVILSIVGTTNGYPNGETLDYSIVNLNPHQVNISSTPQYLDDTTYTEFKFEAPVYIQPNTLYAFILHSESNEYNIFTAVQNATALPSSVKNLPTDATPTVITKIGTAPYIGSLFESQNAITWVADPTKAMMFVVERCVFNTTVNPNIPFIVQSGLPVRKPLNQDIQNYYSSILSNDLQGTLSNDDVAVGAFNFTTTEFTPTGTSAAYTYESTLLSTYAYTAVADIIPGNYGSPTHENVFLDDGKGERLLVANTSNSLYMFVSLSSDSDAVSPLISDDGLSAYVVQWNIDNLSISNDNIILINGGIGYIGGTPNANISISAPDLAGGTQAYASANVANGVIQYIYVTNGGSGYLATPIITITGGNTTPASANTLSEYSASGGNADAKYMTKKVTLSDGNDSQDLRVFYSAYRPQGTNIYVFYRLQNRSDSQIFEEGTWQKMTTVNNTDGYSTSRTDIREFEAAPGVNNVANNQITYTSTVGTIYSTFAQFAIKFVFTTTDKTIIPFLTDLRALALPSGTGI